MARPIHLLNLPFARLILRAGCVTAAILAEVRLELPLLQERVRCICSVHRLTLLLLLLLYPLRLIIASALNCPRPLNIERGVQSCISTALEITAALYAVI